MLRLKVKDRLVNIEDLEYLYNIDDYMSVGIFYSHVLYFIADKKELSITLSKEDSNILNIIDKDKVNNKENINNILYTNIDDIVIPAIGDKIEYTSVGREVDGIYIHPIYLYTHSDDSAEFITNLIIDDTILSISSIFHPMLEEYEIQLKNIGCDFPQDISKAIYEGDIFDDNIDYILLNRKYKELLLNAVDIIYKKGSWRSLIDSFKWFGWEKIAHLREYWKSGNSLMYQDLKQEYSNSLNINTLSEDKSTYISIYYCLNKWRDSGNIEDEWSSGNFKEPIHQLEDNIDDRYEEMELMLKLIMLGNYFSSFFLPIHMDLFSSTVERIVTPITTIKYTSTHSRDSHNLVNNTQPYICRFNKVAWMGDVEVGSIDNTNLRGYKDDNIITGVDYMSNLTLPGESIEQQTAVENYYSGIGKVFSFSIESEVEVTAIVVNISSDEKNILYKRLPIYVCKKEGKFNFKINSNILFKKTGDYKVIITPISYNNTLSTKIMDISIQPPLDQGIEITKLIKKPMIDDYMRYREWRGDHYEYNSKYIEYEDGVVKFKNIDKEQFNLLHNDYTTKNVYNSVFSISDKNVSHNTIHIKLDTEDGELFKISKNIYWWDGEEYHIIENFDDIFDKYISKDELLYKLYNYGYTTCWEEDNGYNFDLKDHMINYMSNYMWWVRCIVNDKKEYQAYLIGLRVETNDVVNKYQPKLFAGDINNTSIQAHNTVDIFYKNSYQPVMWRDSIKCREYKLGEVFRIDPAFRKYRAVDTNISYKIINNSTRKEYDIVALSNPIISTDRLGRGVYDIVYKYIIPSIDKDEKYKEYTYIQESAFIIS